MRRDGRGAPAAVILNMSYTGLGIARDLGERGIPLIGLHSVAAGPGMVSKYGPVLRCPDSAEDGERLGRFLAGLAQRTPRGTIIFPTRDADIFFLDAFREELARHYVLPLPGSEILAKILNKEQLAVESHRLEVPAPRTAAAGTEAELRARAGELGFPLVLKPVYARDWRRPGVWDGVGRTKAIPVQGLADLIGHYSRIRVFNPRVLLQELIPGGDGRLFVFGAYFDRRSRCLGSFVARKRLQYPAEFGTGCLVATAHEPEVERLAVRLLEGLAFSGIAEVEFKYDGALQLYRLIEVNPRHWDQHRLGTACGVNLSLLAYQDLVLGDVRPMRQNGGKAVWLGEVELMRRIGGDIRRGQFSVSGLACVLGRRRVYGTFSWRDPKPFLRRLRFLASGRNDDVAIDAADGNA